MEYILIGQKRYIFLERYKCRVKCNFALPTVRFRSNNSYIIQENYFCILHRLKKCCVFLYFQNAYHETHTRSIRFTFHVKRTERLCIVWANTNTVSLFLYVNATSDFISKCLRMWKKCSPVYSIHEFIDSCITTMTFLLLT